MKGVILKIVGFKAIFYFFYSSFLFYPYLIIYLFIHFSILFIYLFILLSIKGEERCLDTWWC